MRRALKTKHFVTEDMAKISGPYMTYMITLKLIPTVEVRIEIRKVPGKRGVRDSSFEFKTSHVIRTPLLAEPYYSSAVFGNSEDGALRRAIRSITLEYRMAIAAGFDPSPEWLVVNKFW